MPKFKLLLVVFLLVSLSTYGQDTANDTIITDRSKTIKREKSIDISIIQLIANPDKYHGKRVTVGGYLNLEFEGTALFLGREDYEHGLRKNAVWVDVRADRTHPYHKEYVSITGVYDKKCNGHFGSYSGCLRELTFDNKED